MPVDYRPHCLKQRLWESGMPDPIARRSIWHWFQLSGVTTLLNESRMAN
jgi:hypothetical protein